ncbi:MAG: phosphatase PAP2 family protein, partial [Flammeovirgaceae bacterium]|nr:phosphatase PAP2 family protein [Flammeovirgaceae bacterium]MDW8286791.1 phosphatase PAP2 family protein [Flammeovirgaceae bacterium]
TTIALIYRNYGVLYGGMAAALLIGYSRMYLLQHFFEDVYVGAFIGFTTAFVIYNINTKRIYLAILLTMRKIRLYFGLPKPYPLYLLLKKNQLKLHKK